MKYLMTERKKKEDATGTQADLSKELELALRASKEFESKFQREQSLKKVLEEQKKALEESTHQAQTEAREARSKAEISDRARARIQADRDALRREITSMRAENLQTEQGHSKNNANLKLANQRTEGLENDLASQREHFFKLLGIAEMKIQSLQEEQKGSQLSSEDLKEFRANDGQVKLQQMSEQEKLVYFKNKCKVQGYDYQNKIWKAAAHYSCVVKYFEKVVEFYEMG